MIRADYIARARTAKVLAMVDAIDAYYKATRQATPAAYVAQRLREWEPVEWARLAQIADVNTPSAASRNLVIGVFARRAVTLAVAS